MGKGNLKRIIFVETYSLFQLIYLFFLFMRASKIYFHYKIFPPNREINLIKKIVLFIIKKINPCGQITSVDKEILLRENWNSNNSTAILLKDSEQVIADSILCKFLRKLVGDPTVVKCFQSYLQLFSK